VTFAEPTRPDMVGLDQEEYLRTGADLALAFCTPASAPSISGPTDRSE